MSLWISRRVAVTAGSALVVLAVAVVGADQSAREQFERARVTEESSLTEAIRIYEQVLAQAGTDRALAAATELRIGLAHEKLGSAQAAKTYEALVRKFPDQRAVVAEAHARLAALHGPTIRTGLICNRCGQVEGASVSPDGRWIALTDFDVTDEDTGDLLRRDVATGELQRLMAKPGAGKEASANPARYMNPVFSADSSQIAFTVFPGPRPEFAELRVMANSVGAASRVLFKSPDAGRVSPIGWSPDGTSLLIEMQRRHDAGWQIAWVSLADGAVRNVKSLDWRRPDFGGRPALSHDGRFIAYVALSTNPADATPQPDSVARHVYILNADGSNELPITTAPGFYQFVVWTPDDSHVLFTTSSGFQTLDNMGLWASPVRAGRPTGIPVQLERNVGDDDTRTVGITQAGVLYYNTFPGTQQQITVGPVSRATPDSQAENTGGFIGSGPTWSPDGKWLAFVRGVTNNGNVLVIRSLDTGDERIHGYGIAGFGVALSWLPDGSALVMTGSPPYPAQPAVTARQRWRYDLKRDVFERLPQVEVAGYRLGARVMSALSPDGRTEYFLAAPTGTTGPVTQIVAVDQATGSVRRLFTLAPATAAATFGLSPDGRALALVTHELADRGTPRQSRLSIVNVDGSGARHLYGPFPTPALPGGQNFLPNPTWTPDDHIFVGEGPGGPRIMRISVTEGTAVFTGLQVPQANVAVSADGTRVAYTTEPDSNTGQVWALDVSALLKTPQ